MLLEHELIDTMLCCHDNISG